MILARNIIGKGRLMNGFMQSSTVTSSFTSSLLLNQHKYKQIETTTSNNNGNETNWGRRTLINEQDKINQKRSYCTKSGDYTSQEIHELEHIKTTEGPLFNYDTMIANKKIRVDKHQRETVKLLQTLYNQLKQHRLTTVTTVGDSVKETPTSFSKWMSSFISDTPTDQVTENKVETKGIYLFGDVGCGKSFLMDLFYDSVNIQKKKRVHFHHFMLDVHKRIHKWRQTRSIDDKDPLPLISRQLVDEAWLLCFDEFQVTDVADAMILKRLFQYMFDYGAVLVATSNRQPSDLYMNGLNRQLFLPFIDFLKSKCIVHNLNSGLDYRLSGTRTKRIYFQPLSESNSKEVDALFQTLTHNEPVLINETVAINASRNLVIPISARGVARFTFKQLCDTALGAADYIVLAQNYHTVVIDSIPQMDESTKNQARRFITLVDVLYEHKVKMICSAASSPAQLFMSRGPTDTSSDHSLRHMTDDLSLTPEQLSRFTGEEERFMFSRAVSRLIEMQSDQYLSSHHNPQK